MVENGGRQRRVGGVRRRGSSRGGTRAGWRAKIGSGEASDKLRNGLRKRSSRGDIAGTGGRGRGGRSESRGVFPSNKIQTRRRDGGKDNLKKIDLK